MNNIIDRMAALQLEEKRPIFPVVDTAEIAPWKIGQGKQSCLEIAAVNERITALYKGLGDRSADSALTALQLEEIAVQIAPSKRAFKAFAKRMWADKELLIPMLMQASVTYILVHSRLTYLHSIAKEKPYKKTLRWVAAKAQELQTADSTTTASLWEQIKARIELKTKKYASYESAPFKNMITSLHLEVARFARQAACELESDVLAATIDDYIKTTAGGTVENRAPGQGEVPAEAPVWGAPFNPFWLGRVYNWYMYPEANAVSNELRLIAGRNDALKSDIEQLLSKMCSQGLAPADTESFRGECLRLQQRQRKCFDDFVKENENLYAGPRNALVVAAANYASGLKEAIYDTASALELLQQFTTDESLQFLGAFYLCMQLFSPNTESSTLKRLEMLFVFARKLQMATCHSGKHKINTFINHTIQTMKDTVRCKGRQLIEREPEEKMAWHAVMQGLPLAGAEEGLPEVVRTLMLKLLFEHTYFSADTISWELRALLFALDKNEHYKDLWEKSEALHPDCITAVLPHKSDWPWLPVVHTLFSYMCRAEISRDPTSYAFAWKLLCDFANLADPDSELLTLAQSKLTEIQKRHAYLYMPPSMTFELDGRRVVNHPLAAIQITEDLQSDEKQALLCRALASSLCPDEYPNEYPESLNTILEGNEGPRKVSQIIENPRFREFFDARGDNRDMVYQNTANKLDSRNFEIELPEELKPTRKRKHPVQSFSKVQHPSLGIGLNEASLFLEGPLRPVLWGLTTFLMQDIDKQFLMYYIVEYEKEQENKGFTQALTALLKEEGYTKWFTACEKALSRSKE